MEGSGSEVSESESSGSEVLGEDVEKKMALSVSVEDKSMSVEGESGGRIMPSERR